MTIDDVKANLGGLAHGGSIDDVTEIEMLLERAANTLLSKIDPLETIRNVSMASTIYDDVYDYALPSDYKTLIDLMPQGTRESEDKSARTLAMNFDVNKAITEKTISIEGSDGTKIMRVNWRAKQGKTLNQMNSTTANGTWSAVNGSTNIVADSIVYVSGSASIRFDLAATGDGIQNTNMTAIDLSDEENIADCFVWVYLPSAVTSVTARWGNDLTANYWTAVAQTTQADGNAFKVGWNLLKFPWSTATKTGSASASTVDSFQITLATSGAVSNVRVDNIVFTVGRAFDIKYYSKYLFKNSSGTWLSRPTADTDSVVLDNDGLQIYFMEALIAIAQQNQNNAIDINWANLQLNGDASSVDPHQRMGLYARYRAEHPSMAVKAVSSYGSNPARGRW